MNPPRYKTIYNFPPVVDGKNVCRWCGEPRGADGRTSYCSSACSDEVGIRRSGSFARWKVEERDQGVCVRCGRDTLAQAAAARSMAKRIKRLRSSVWYEEDERTRFWSSVYDGIKKSSWADGRRVRVPASRSVLKIVARGQRSRFWERAEKALGLSIPKWAHWESGNHSWEMNHIIPVWEGGGCCGLENLETLCIECHAEETKAQAGRRAADRKAATFERKLRISDADLGDGQLHLFVDQHGA